MNSPTAYDKYITLLKANKNIILTGAPGTGKTFLAKEISKAMGAEWDFVQFHPSYDYTDFVEGLRPTVSDKNGNIGFERKNGVFKQFCIQAICPRTITEQESINLLKQKIKDSQNTLSIPYVDSNKAPFKICLTDKGNIKVTLSSGSTQSATDEDIIESLIQDRRIGEKTYPHCIAQYIKKNIKKNIKKPFVFIIDEINRGEISKIFGELFFSIDPGYRGENGRVKTQYQNLITDKADPFYDGFYVPENVYIIGTMNDIDRSVESMDFAMRRRFAWIEINADENLGMLDSLGSLKNDVVHKMRQLNQAIWDDESNEGIEGLSSAYHIGGAYFSKIGLYLNHDGSNIDEAYGQLWNNHLKGILYEYLRGSVNASENMDKLENAYFSM